MGILKKTLAHTDQYLPPAHNYPCVGFFFGSAAIEKLIYILTCYCARHTLLMFEDQQQSAWVSIRNILFMHQCAAAEIILARKGWKISVIHHDHCGFPVYAARSKNGKKLKLRYIDYQEEMTKIR
ncbi:hypothetical protein P4W15_02325 [Morganella morganii]|nr:hypothetical protein [Morganella morganii]